MTNDQQITNGLETMRELSNERHRRICAGIGCTYKFADHEKETLCGNCQHKAKLATPKQEDVWR